MYLNINPAAKDIKALLTSVQSHATDDEINQVITSLKGKSIHQLISEGHTRVGASGPAPAGGAKGGEKKEAVKK
jgi:large subunit ribosomal protein LP2